MLTTILICFSVIWLTASLCSSHTRLGSQWNWSVCLLSMSKCFDSLSRGKLLRWPEIRSTWTVSLAHSLAHFCGSLFSSFLCSTTAQTFCLTELISNQICIYKKTISNTLVSIIVKRLFKQLLWMGEALGWLLVPSIFLQLVIIKLLIHECSNFKWLEWRWFAHCRWCFLLRWGGDQNRESRLSFLSIYSFEWFYAVFREGLG